MPRTLWERDRGRGRARLTHAWAAMVCCLAAFAATAQDSQARPFGIDSFALQTTVAEPVAVTGGSATRYVNQPYAFAQAGGHPDALTATVRFATEEVGEGHRPTPTRDPKDVAIELPQGMLADPEAAALCPAAQAATLGGGLCPADTQVGVFAIRYAEKLAIGPIVDVAPQAGQAAQLGLEISEPNITLAMTGALVRTPRGYGFSLAATGLPAVGIEEVEITLWGVPAALAHDPQRGLFCNASAASALKCQGGGEPAGLAPTPFLTMPDDCAAGAPTAILQADSWEEPGRYVQAAATLPAPTGCRLLPFAATLQAQPQTALADEPTGLGLTVETLQPEGPEALTSPPLREVAITLPQGVSLSPATAAGMSACPASGPEGIDIPSGAEAAGALLAPDQAGEGEEIAPDGLARPAPGHCPQTSTIASASASTPLLAGPLEGHVYLAQPLCGGAGRQTCTAADAADGRLLRIYIELQSEGGVGGVRASGGKPAVVIKLAGYIEANPASGQLTVVLPEAPQLPLSRLSISLTGGPRAVLANPPQCGTATTNSILTPWSAPGITPAGLPVAGTPDATPSSFYEVSGCQTPQPFAPGFLAGTLSSRAGVFASLAITLTRGDREQYFSAIQAQLPPGLLARLGGVPLCPSAQAAAGSCPGASRIGETTMFAGAGSAPLELPGSIYLTGPYAGAPFGLAILTDVNVGPLDLGPLVIRAKVDVAPDTGALRITSDPLPQIFDGVPLRVQRLALAIDRPGFLFNPSGCGAKRISARVLGAGGAVASVSSPFAVGRCQPLSFDPQISAAASLSAARGGGASFQMKIAFPVAAQGTQADPARLAIRLPRRLPSRLRTIQRACPASTFARNPAACPPASVLGVAEVATRVLSGTLVGPLYFVSRGASAFPQIVAVLQGDGVQARLSGTAKIAGGTIAIAFSALPDVPVISAQLYLPAGPRSALGAAAGVCHRSRARIGVPLSMPLVLEAQNGAIARREVRVPLSGCR